MADIPADIASQILERLTLEDQIRFRAVCRSWHSFRGVKPLCKHPWLFIYEDTEKNYGRVSRTLNYHGKESIIYDDGFIELSYSGNWSYSMYNPSTGKSHQFHVTLPEKIYGSRPYKSRALKIVATHSGWLLFESNVSSEMPFLCNPFTRRAIFLPAHTSLTWLELSSEHPNYAFEYCHNKQRFTVYAVWEENNKVVMSTWRSGDVAWKTEELVGVSIFTPFFRRTPAHALNFDASTLNGNPILAEAFQRYNLDKLASLKTFWIETPTL